MFENRQIQHEYHFASIFELRPNPILVSFFSDFLMILQMIVLIKIRKKSNAPNTASVLLD